jgi:hypothetical protein
LIAQILTKHSGADGDTIWGNGSETGLISKNVGDASGAIQSITGIGFKPHLVLLFGVINGQVSFSIGVRSASVGDRAFAQSPDPLGRGSNVWNTTGSGSIFLALDGSNYINGAVQSLDPDGFTLQWTKSGSPSGTAYIGYICLR